MRFKGWTMRRQAQSISMFSATFLSLGILFLMAFDPATVKAQVMSDYTAAPPFAGNTVTPNVLFILDNSGSMAARAQCHLQSGDFDTCATFVAATTYSGMHDSMKCYTYDGANSRFEESGSAKGTITSNCANTLWDGNFLNWITA